MRRIVWAGAVGLLAACQLGNTAELVFERDPRVLYAVETEAPLVALTLDDGPDAVATPQLLGVLEAHRARATFFLLGERVEAEPGVVASILAGGHEIANHGMRDVPAVDLAPAEFEADLLAADAVLRAFAPQRWYRPGSGWYEDWMFPILERHGYRMALGSAYPLDAALPSVPTTSRLALWQLEPGGILVLHDVGRRGERSARTLERVLPELADRGLRVVTLSELVAACGGC